MQTTQREPLCRISRVFPSNLAHAPACLAIVTCLLMFTSFGHAQATATVEGLVTDSTGAVLRTRKSSPAVSRLAWRDPRKQIRTATTAWRVCRSALTT